MQIAGRSKWLAAVAMSACLASSAMATTFRTEVGGVATGSGSVTIIVEDFTSPAAAPFPVSFVIPSGSTAQNSTGIMTQAMKDQLPGQFSLTQHTNCVTLDGPIANVTVSVETVPGQTFTAASGACSTSVVTHAPVMGPALLALLAAGFGVVGVRRIRRRHPA
jgi:hypothetical protein